MNDALVDLINELVSLQEDLPKNEGRPSVEEICQRLTRARAYAQQLMDARQPVMITEPTIDKIEQAMSESKVLTIEPDGVARWEPA